MSKDAYTKRIEANAKREATFRKRVLEMIEAKPGIASAHLPRNYRRFLRPLELEGKIIYKSMGWYIGHV